MNLIGEIGSELMYPDDKSDNILSSACVRGTALSTSVLAAGTSKPHCFCGLHERLHFLLMLHNGCSWSPCRTVGSFHVPATAVPGPHPPMGERARTRHMAPHRAGKPLLGTALYYGNGNMDFGGHGTIYFAYESLLVAIPL